MASNEQVPEPPTHAYFRPKHGRWAGEHRFTTESLRALFAGSMSLYDKLVFAMLGLTCRLLGSLRIETSVDASALDRRRVDHTTRVSKWGLPLQWSEEWFELSDDGRTLVVHGAVRTMPFFFWRRPFRESRGEVDQAGEGASYRFAWGGATITQRSIPQGDDLRFEQETDGCRGSFVLRRMS